MSIHPPATQKKRWSIWVLMAGVLGIGNFALCFLTLMPRVDGSTIYFWPIQFYGYAFFPSAILFPPSLIIVAFWFGRLAKRVWLQNILAVAGIPVSVLCILFPLWVAVYLDSLSIVGRIAQNDRTYYLVRYWDRSAVDFAFCQSDKIGFSGQCKRIAFQVAKASDPEFYIDQTTNLITIKFENPPGIWKNSTSPTYMEVP